MAFIVRHILQNTCSDFNALQPSSASRLSQG